MKISEIKNSEDHPIPDDAVWQTIGDKLFYESAKETNDKIHYVTYDGVYHLSSSEGE